jgi:hypothetical protein
MIFDKPGSESTGMLIGVENRGDILATEADQFENDDKFLLHVNNLMREPIGLEYAGFIRFQLVPMDSKKVLLIECQPSPSPVFLKIGKNEDFYVRIGSGSRRLSTSEVPVQIENGYGKRRLRFFPFLKKKSTFLF